MTIATLQTRPGLIQKVLALLDSDHAGEVRAAAHALKRMLQDGGAPAVATPAAPPPEIEACLTYATEAVALLTGEIRRLRRENARLHARLREPRPRAASSVH